MNSLQKKLLKSRISDKQLFGNNDLVIRAKRSSAVKANSKRIKTKPTPKKLMRFDLD